MFIYASSWMCTSMTSLKSIYVRHLVNVYGSSWICIPMAPKILSYMIPQNMYVHDSPLNSFYPWLCWICVCPWLLWHCFMYDAFWAGALIVCVQNFSAMYTHAEGIHVNGHVYSSGVNFFFPYESWTYAFKRCHTSILQKSHWKVHSRGVKYEIYFRGVMDIHIQLYILLYIFKRCYTLTSFREVLNTHDQRTRSEWVIHKTMSEESWTYTYPTESWIKVIHRSHGHTCSGGIIYESILGAIGIHIQDEPYTSTRCRT